MKTKRLLIGLSCAVVALAAVSIHLRLGAAAGADVLQGALGTVQDPKAEAVRGSEAHGSVLTGAINLHAHFGPDSYDRQWDASSREARERAGHARHRPQEPLDGVRWPRLAGSQVGAQGIEVFGSVTLDTPVGGVNPMAVRYMADVEGTWGRIVWMPTHDSEHEVNYNKDTRAKAIVSRNGKLIPEVFEVLDLIKERNLTLATGHLTPEEVLMVMAEAKQRGITRIIVTHPLLGAQFTNMSLPQMQEAVKLGGAIEITAGALSRDGAAKTRAIEVIKALGTQNVFVASDSGLVGTPNHPDALVMAIEGLRAAGFSEPDLNRMFKETPARLVGLPIQ